jgi:hypothetical protein
MSSVSPWDFRVIPLLTTEPMGRLSTAGPLAVRLQTYETGTENGRGNLGNPDSWHRLGQATQHQANHRHLDHRLPGLVPVLVVLAQTAAIRQPGEGPFHHPTLRQEFESLDIIIPFNDLQDPLTKGADPTDQLPRLTAVGPHPLHPRPRSQELGLGEDQLGAITVLDVRRVNHHGQ